MARAAALQGAHAGALDGDRHRLGHERPPAVGRQIELRVVGVDLLDEDVLHVGAGVGETPRQGIGAAEQHEGHAGQCRAHDIDRGRLRPLERQVGEIPGGGGREPQVRIVGQQRLAGARTFARDDPVVGGATADEVFDRRVGRVLLPATLALEGVKGGQLG